MRNTKRRSSFLMIIYDLDERVRGLDRTCNHIILGNDAGAQKKKRRAAIDCALVKTDYIPVENSDVSPGRPAPPCARIT